MKHVFAMNLIDKIFLETWNSKNICDVLYFTNRCFHLNIANVDYLVSLSIGSTNNNRIGIFKLLITNISLLVTCLESFKSTYQWGLKWSKLVTVTWNRTLVTNWSCSIIWTSYYFIALTNCQCYCFNLSWWLASSFQIFVSHSSDSLSQCPLHPQYNVNLCFLLFEDDLTNLLVLMNKASSSTLKPYLKWQWLSLWRSFQLSCENLVGFLI
jgi:hypothetical protein